MEKRRTQSSPAGYPRDVRNFDIPEPALHKESRHAKIKSRAISRAVRRPGQARVDQCGVAFVQHRHFSGLAILPYSVKLANHNAGPVFRLKVRGGELVKG